MAHPFPPGSTLRFSPPPIPSPLYHHAHNHSGEGGFPRPFTHKSQADTQDVARSDVRGITYATGFIFIQPPNGALKICIIYSKIDLGFLRCP